MPTKKKDVTLPNGQPIDEAKQYHVVLAQAVHRPHGIILRPGEAVRVSGRILAEILDQVDGDPVEA